MKNGMADISRFAMTWPVVGFLLALSPVHFAQATNPPQSATTPVLDQLRVEHQRVLDDLNAKDAEGRPMELDDPRVPEILKKGWDLTGAWASAYFEAHSAPSTRELEQIFDGFAPKPQGVKSPYGDFLEYHDYTFWGSAVRIGPSIYVIRASYGIDFLTGTFMVVARNTEGHFQALWNIKDLAEKHYAQRDEIGRWLHLVRRAYYNGPLSVSRILPVSPSANGNARFLVDAHQGADGGTQLDQLSIWEWDGAEAKPLLVELYQYAADFGGFRFDGRTVRITTKEELETFFSCGMCPEPRGVWMVRIGPRGVRNLGHRFLKPELQWADELLSKIEKGEDTTNLADGKVVEVLKARIREGQAEDDAQARDTSEKTKFSWGMLGKCRVFGRGQRGAFDLELDEGQMRFSYVLRNGKPYFTHVRIQWVTVSPDGKTAERRLSSIDVTSPTR